MKRRFFGLSFGLFMTADLQSYCGYFLAMSELCVNCSQTKFVAIFLVLLSFVHAIFCLTDFSSNLFDFLF